MLFKSSFHLLIYSSVLLILIYAKRLKRDTPSYAPKCSHHTTAVDQVIDYPVSNETSRGKRFVLFPEFVLFRDDWKYLNQAKNIRYWISNFYPKRIPTEYVHRYIQDVIRQINTVLDEDIILEEAADPGEANFHFDFFDYTKCPKDDPEATTENVLAVEPLAIYPVELTRKSRYRAHGGMTILEGSRQLSMTKYNMQQTFLLADDYIYEPVIYTCTDETNECQIDLFWALLHETLHGFGIEHTTNAEKPKPPNERMESVMHFSPLRILCHDDLRAIRAVYNFTVKRSNAEFDDTCRRDFPMSFLQKLMYLLGRYIIFGFFGFLILSFAIFVLTMIYILLRPWLTERLKGGTSSKSTGKAVGQNKPHGYLWHDDVI